MTMPMNPYGTTPMYGQMNPYATLANPYAPNPINSYQSAMNYTQPTAQPTVTPTMPVQHPVMNITPAANNGPFIPVPNVGAVKDAQVPANQTGWFMNQNVQEFYVKSADNLGICQTKYYRFSEFDPEQEAQMAMQAQAIAQQQVVTQPIGITREEVEEIVTEKLEAYKSFLMPTQKPATASKAKKDADNA